MYPLAHGRCIGRRATCSVGHFVRFASNKASQNRANNPAPDPPQASPVAPTASKRQIPSSPATQTSSDSPSRSPRIASSWNNVVIPTREEILKRPRKIVPGHDRGSSYRPDLSYLRKGSPTSFASRLAEEAIPKKPTAADKQQTEERERRIAELTAQRRAERLAREAAQKANAAEANLEKPRKRVQPAARQADAYAGIDAAMQKDQRRGAQSGQRGQQPPRRGPGAQSERKASNTRRDARPLRVPVVTKARTTQLPDASSNEDITLEILEQGGDDKAPAEFRTPDLPFTNLDELFGPSREKRLEDATRSGSNFPEAQVQWLREAYGGDYSRFAPQTSAEFVTPHRELGPLKHAQLVLAKRRDVTVGARKDALAIISSAVGEAGTKAVQRA